MALISIGCPNPGCGYSGRVDESKLGTRVFCRKCGTSFLVTREGAKDARISTPSGGQAGAPSAAAGDLIGGRYRIERLLGQGGMGEVWLASDTALHNRSVAVKRILQQGLDEDAIQRFEREVRALAALTHPHIVAVTDTGRDAKGLYYVMEYVPGQSLRAWLQQQDQANPPSLVQVQDLFRQILRGVAFAHSKDIIHRDLKPENVLLTDDGTVKVLDFGLARLGQDFSLTRPEQRLGTPLYMSPEQCRGAPCDARSDVYALGVMLFELCTLECPFQGASWQVLMYQHQNADPPLPKSYRKELPDTVNLAILKALEKNPKNRYTSAKEFLIAIESAESPRLASPSPHPAVAMSVEEKDHLLRDAAELAWADGTLSQEERNLLMARAARLGISELRANEIIDMCAPRSASESPSAEPVFKETPQRDQGSDIFIPTPNPPIELAPEFQCSRCGPVPNPTLVGTSAYCPNCGAALKKDLRASHRDAPLKCPTCGSSSLVVVGATTFCSNCGRVVPG